MAFKEIKYSGVEVLPKSYLCKSTDAKPTTGIVDGSTAKEVDTGNKFVFYEGSWWPD